MATRKKKAWSKPKKKTTKKKKRHKYSAIKSTSSDGMYTFPSRLEKRTYEHLRLLEKAGEIKFLKTQVRVEMTDASIIYMVDFLIYDLARSEEVWVEAKGIETDVWRLKKRLWKYYGPGRLQIYRAHPSQGCILSEEIVPKGYVHHSARD